MVFAMHQIQVATIVRHLDSAPWFESYLRQVCAEQRLIASVTSEVGTGGDMGRSIAAITRPRTRGGCASRSRRPP
jgi:acyl-CoA dehydrogenase